MGVTFIAKEGTYTAPATLTTKTITENGTYSAVDDSANGYSSVTVEVEGGGSSWQTVFEGSVETVDDDGDIFGIIENLTLTGDSIKATLNGTEYILPKTEHGFGAENESGLDFSTYPLFIATGEGFCNLWTPTAGTYTLKIEEEQSGGSSDFSTAQVTIIWTNPIEVIWDNCPIIENDMINGSLYADISPAVVTVPLYKGKCCWNRSSKDFALSGNIEKSDGGLLITGDCTITIS